MLTDVAAERLAQDARFGVQEFPDGTGPDRSSAADRAKAEVRAAWERGELTWRHILTEEFLEALAETEPGPLRTELVQTAAVAVKWIQSLDKRHGYTRHEPLPAVLRHAVRALLLDGDELILLRRTKPSRAVYWTTPGGGLDEDDASPQEALRRELDEELGATAGPLGQVYAICEQTPVGDYLHTFYLCRLKSLDLSRRHGPELADPARGRYDLERVPCTPEALAALDIRPPLLAAYLAEHARDLPRLVDRLVE